MGAFCCVDRKEIIKFPPQILNFDPKKNGLAIAFVSLFEDSCQGLKHKLDLLYEISQQYAYNHECCFIDPNYLQEKFGLIEFQSLRRKFQAGVGLAHAVEKEIQYLIDEYLIIDEDNYSVIILLMFGSNLHPFSLKKKTLSEDNVQYIIHDIFPAVATTTPQGLSSPSSLEERYFKGVTCQNIVFNSQQKLYQYLNKVSLYYCSQNPQIFTQKVQLLTFQIADDKSFTCSESDLSFLHEQEFNQSMDQCLNRSSKGRIQRRSNASPQKSSFGQKSYHKSSQILQNFGEIIKQKTCEQEMTIIREQDRYYYYSDSIKESQNNEEVRKSTGSESTLRTTKETSSNSSSKTANQNVGNLLPKHQ